MFRLAAQRAIASRRAGSPRGMLLAVPGERTRSDLATRSRSQGVSLPHPVLVCDMAAIFAPAAFVYRHK